MFSPRSLRKAASPVVVAGASCVVAVLTLTGCGDDDKPSQPPPLPSMEMPSLKPLIPGGLGTSSNASSPGGAGGSAPQSPASGAAASGPAATGKSSTSPPRIKLAIGECVDLDGTGNLKTVPCTIPHWGEVGVLYTLPETTDPAAPTYKADVNAKCEELLLPVRMRQPNPNAYGLLAYHPSARSWANDHDREVACIMTDKQTNVQLTGKLK